MTVVKKFIQAWRQRDRLGDQHHDRELAQFLPAALEIQATPPHPMAHRLTWSLVILFTLGITWACLSPVNVVASAEGKIIPSSRVKQIQPLEKAVVKAILVAEGQLVKQGDPLVELDNTLTQADQTRLASELTMTQGNLSVSQVFMQRLANKPVDHMTDSLYQQLLNQQWQSYSSQQQGLQNALERNQAEQAATQAQITKLEQTLPIIQRRAEKMQQLRQNQYASEEEFLALEQQRIEQTQDLRSERQRLKQLQAANAETQQQIQQLLAQTQAAELTKIADYQGQIATLQEELTKAQDLNAKQILYAPVDGRVKELAITTVGGVVTEAQQLMLIVPDDDQLQAEVFLENKDIGFVFEGMEAEIKIHTFPFTKYGLIHGEIKVLSDDAILDEKRGLIYSMQVLMKDSSINVDGKQVKLIPGMAVTAEIQTGQRRIIEFFLAPLLRHTQEGLRER